VKSNYQIKMLLFGGKLLLVKLEFSNPLPHGWDTPTPVVLQAPWPCVLPTLTRADKSALHCCSLAKVWLSPIGLKLARFAQSEIGGQESEIKLSN